MHKGKQTKQATRNNSDRKIYCRLMASIIFYIHCSYQLAPEDRVTIKIDAVFLLNPSVPHKT